MAKTEFTPEEIELLKANKYVKNVTPVRVLYTDEFIDLLVSELSSGKGATSVFRNAGFPVKLLGAKRIERTAARLRKEHGIIPLVSAKAGSQFANTNGRLADYDGVAFKNKHISRRELKRYIKEVPQPLQDHADRCKKLASYVIERICLTDRYIALGLKQEDIEAAVYYHDIGKAFLDKDCYYFEHCSGAAQRANYIEHIQKGHNAVYELAALSEGEELADKSFAKLLLDAIDYHHSYNSDICPKPKRQNAIPFVGRLTAIVDCFDHLYFDADNGRDFDKAVREFSKIAKGKFDAKLVKALIGNKKLLAEYLTYIDKKAESGRKASYGMYLKFDPVIAIRTEKKQCKALLFETYINDPYYGEISPEAYRFAAEQTGQIISFEKLALQRLCVLLSKQLKSGRKLPGIHFRLSPSHLSTKTGFAWVRSTLQKHEIPADTICFLLKEEELLSKNISVSILSKTANELGMRIGICGFGASQLSLLPSLKSNMLELVYFSPEAVSKAQDEPSSESIISGELDILDGLGISAVFPGVEDEFLERTALKMGASYACGGFYSTRLNETRLYKFCIDMDEE